MDSNASSSQAEGGYPPYYPPTNYQQSHGQQQPPHPSNQPPFPSRSSSSSFPLIGHPSSSSTYRGPLSQPLLPSPSPSASPPHNHSFNSSKRHAPSFLPPKPSLHSSSSTDSSSSSSLQRRLAESEAARATLEATNASLVSEREKKDAKLAQFIEERKRVKEDEEFSEALALDHQSQITRLEGEKAALKEQVDELGDELEGSKKGREEETRGLRKRVEQLEKKLSLKARENETLRGELSSEGGRYEALLEERGISVEEGKALELENALKAGRELARELEGAREALEVVRTESEKGLRDALEAKDRQITRLGEEKESIAAALQESESERTKQMDKFSAFSASFQSFNKRPLDASSSTSSRASQPPQKKAKFQDGMPKTKAERTLFIDHWLALLFAKRNEDRMCVICERLNAKAPSPIPTKPIKLEPNVKQSEVLTGKALLGHLETSHGPGWKKICAGLEEKK